jgi:hypothetical protein
VAYVRERKYSYKVLVGRSERKRLLGRPRHGWEDIVRMDLREIGWEMWIGFIWLKMETSGRLL